MRKFIATALAATTLAAMPSAAHAGAVITNGNISLGVNDAGQLNFDSRGVFDNRTGFDGTRAGCECEGWGVADAGNGTSGWANDNEGGAIGLSGVTFGSTASTATSVVDIIGASSMQVEHLFAPSLSPDLFEVNVTITNIGVIPISDLRYRRLMDWDIEPTAFSEYVTIQGLPAAAVLGTTDNGFLSADPLSGRAGIVAGTTDVNFVDSGVADHGAQFDFGFGALAPGASHSFRIFYGASLSEGDALAALGTVGAEVYSFGQSSDNIDGLTPDRSTFIFGFAGVGGEPVPGGVPEPSTWLMLILGFMGIGSTMRMQKRRAKASVRYA